MQSFIETLTEESATSETFSPNSYARFVIVDNGGNEVNLQVSFDNGDNWNNYGGIYTGLNNLEFQTQGFELYRFAITTFASLTVDLQGLYD